VTHLGGTLRALKHRAPVRFHSGTVEIQGKVLLLEADTLAPNSSGWIQILLEEPTVLAPGDHFILRHQTPMVTLGGGRIVSIDGGKRKRSDAAMIASLKERLAVLDKPDDFLAALLVQETAPRQIAELCGDTAQLPAQVLTRLKNLEKKNRAVALRADAVYMAPKNLDEALKATVGCLYDYFKAHPALGVIERPELKRRLALKSGDVVAVFFEDILEKARQRNLLTVESNTVALPGRDRTLEGALAKQAECVEAAFLRGGLAPPPPEEIESELKIASKLFKEIMRFLTDTGKIVNAAPDVIFHMKAYEKAWEETQALFAAKAENTTSEIRQHLSMSRKYVVPLVELFDKRGLTERVGDKRKLKTK